MQLVTFTTRSRLLITHQQDPAARFYDTSTHAPYATDFPWVTDASEFSPFCSYGNIPIPGMPRRVSDSVEGIWQGLKIIKGRIDEEYFRGKGRRRVGRVEGHHFGQRKLDYVSARRQIYVPAYTYMIGHSVPQSSLKAIYACARENIPQFFFDVDENPDITNKSSPLAHSSVLVQIINKALNEQLHH